jgi:hypothetical protein
MVTDFDVRSTAHLFEMSGLVVQFAHLIHIKASGNLPVDGDFFSAQTQMSKAAYHADNAKPCRERGRTFSIQCMSLG